jgi:hypothetical protein
MWDIVYSLRFILDKLRFILDKLGVLALNSTSDISKIQFNDF